MKPMVSPGSMPVSCSAGPISTPPPFQLGWCSATFSSPPSRIFLLPKYDKGWLDKPCCVLSDMESARRVCVRLDYPLHHRELALTGLTARILCGVHRTMTTALPPHLYTRTQLSKTEFSHSVGHQEGSGTGGHWGHRMLPSSAEGTPWRP